MKVLQLGPYPPPYGGVQTHLVAIREHLQDRGHQCEVVNITRHRSATEPGVHHPTSAAQLLRTLKRLEYDVIHLHVGGGLPNRVLALAAACTVQKARSVFTFHSGGYPSSPAGAKAGVRSKTGWVLRRFDAVIGVNQELCDFFAKVGIPGSRIHHMVPHISRPPRPDRTEPHDALERFRASHDPLLLTVGLLEPEYDLPRQIQTLEAVRERFPGAGLAIIGSGSLQHDLERLIQEVPWGDHVLLCGDVPHEQTLAAIATSNVVLRTTLYDGDAISVREALDAGTPVVATDNGMRPMGVHLVPVEDSSALEQAIFSVLSESAEVAAASNRSSSDAVEDLLEIYRGD